ncbi:MAG TPA: hypothetical protein VGV85_08590 [Longimicrobiaceae bacterium]|nr:hypothetical protein [Longimicrobiaceae bacterium]
MRDVTVRAVDFSNMAHRMWFRARSLEALAGAVLRELEGQEKRHGRAAVRVCLDSPFPSFRSESPLLPDFKGGRSKGDRPGTTDMTDACRGPLVSAGYRLREADGMEADDVVTTVVAEAVRAACRVDVVSKDTDLLQVVDDARSVRVLWPDDHGGETVMDEAAVRAYFLAHKDYRAPVSPGQILDLRVLAGGKDNLPRVEIPGDGRPFGFTTARAADLLSQGASLDSLYAGDRWRCSPKEARWLDHCREAAFARRDVLRLRSDLVLQCTDPAGGSRAPAAAPAAPAGPEMVPCLDCGKPAPANKASYSGICSGCTPARRAGVWDYRPAGAAVAAGGSR